MGYTHYWTPKEASPEKWDDFVKTCKKLNDSLPASVVIAGGMGEGKPEFSSKAVYFNGSDDLSHETFFIAPDSTEWAFCKTNYKPYDLLVCACLIAAEEILGYDISSDGDIEDWQPAIDLYAKVTGKVYELNLD